MFIKFEINRDQYWCLFSDLNFIPLSKNIPNYDQPTYFIFGSGTKRFLNKKKKIARLLSMIQVSISCFIYNKLVMDSRLNNRLIKIFNMHYYAFPILIMMVFVTLFYKRCCNNFSCSNCPVVFFPTTPKNMEKFCNIIKKMW